MRTSAARGQVLAEADGDRRAQAAAAHGADRVQVLGAVSSRNVTDLVAAAWSAWPSNACGGEAVQKTYKTHQVL